MKMISGIGKLALFSATFYLGETISLAAEAAI
jgi:hypothetical protein